LYFTTIFLFRCFLFCSKTRSPFQLQSCKRVNVSLPCVAEILVLLSVLKTWSGGLQKTTLICHYATSDRHHIGHAQSGNVGVYKTELINSKTLTF